ncbi:MAG: MFS transporter [Oscillospiraceae bacterium]|nr:MFS transporter [Oscillospiraceae bacterium]
MNAVDSSASSLNTPSKWKVNIVLFMVGQAVSLFGSSLVYFAVMWHITLSTQSGVMMTLIMIAGMLPIFLISPFAGVWADRYNKKHLINISDAFTAVVTLVMAIMFTLGNEYTALLLICIAARAAAQGVQMPTVTALIPELVPEEHLTRINGVNSSINTFTTFASPALGGVLLAIAPIHLLMYIDVVTAAIGIGILMFLVKVPVPAEKIIHESGMKQYLKEIGEGLKYIKSNVFMMKSLVICAVMNFMIATTAMTPLLVIRKWGDGLWNLTENLSIGAEHRLAISEMGYSAGLVLGGIAISIWVGFKNKNHTYALFTFLAGIATAGLGLSSNFWIYTLFMGLGAGFISMRGAPSMAMIQINISREYMGRCMSVFMMIATLNVQLGMLLWGPLSDIISLDWLLVAAGSCIILTGIIVFFDKTLRKAGLATRQAD